MKHLLASAAGALSLVLAACGSSGGNSSASDAVPAGGATVSVVQVDGIGSVLVDSTGMALYSPDEEADSTVRCTDACLSFWTPLEAGSAAPTAPAGVANLGVIERPDGTRQVTDDGRPLYTFSEDSPGNVKGDGFSDDFGRQHLTWHAVLADGASASSPGGTSNHGTTGDNSTGAIPGY